ncbi:hydrophobin 2 [Aphelenchoides avenae]|nr:hydrophobin 2 [Aphelenchus avenae]KAH7716398.1 hydrophobin 2 [Aphelenchus avenae]
MENQEYLQACCSGPNVNGILVLGCSSSTTTNCNTGTLQCCTTVASVQSAAVQNLAGLLGVVIQDISLDAGLTCTAVNVNECGGAAA